MEDRARADTPLWGGRRVKEAGLGLLINRSSPQFPKGLKKQAQQSTQGAHLPTRTALYGMETTRSFVIVLKGV